MTQTKEFLNLKELLKSKKALIGIVGMGYVGLPLALAYAKNGFKVIGLDIDEKKVKKINRSQSYIKHISNDEIHKYVSKGLIKATSNFEDSRLTSILYNDAGKTFDKFGQEVSYANVIPGPKIIAAAATDFLAFGTNQVTETMLFTTSS